MMLMTLMPSQMKVQLEMMVMNPLEMMEMMVPKVRDLEMRMVMKRLKLSTLLTRTLPEDYSTSMTKTMMAT